MSTKIQVDNFILFFFCYLCGVDDMRVISMVIAKKIVFACLICSVDVYHHIECDITDFSWLKYCCDLVGDIPTWFQVLGKVVMHIFPVWGRSYIRLFWTNLCNFYLYVNYFGIKYITMQIYLYIYMDVLR